MPAGYNKNRANIAMQLSHFVAQIYHQSQGNSEVNFKKWCCENLQKIISFDSFFWITNFNPERFSNTSDVYSYNIGKELLINHELITLKQTNEPIFKKAIHLPNQPIIHSPSIEKEIYLNHSNICEKHVQEHILITFCKRDGNINGRLIGFCRDSHKQPYTQQEINIKAFVLPHLFEGLHLNRLSQLSQKRKYPNSCLAVCDQQLYIIKAEDGFYSLLGQDLKINGGKKCLPSTVLVQPSVGEVKLEMTASKEIYFVEAYYDDPLLSSLTKKEGCILNLLRQGLSNKEISAGLKISTKTLNNHLSSIYQKFGMRSKNKILAYLSNPSTSNT